MYPRKTLLQFAASKSGSLFALLGTCVLLISLQGSGLGQSKTAGPQPCVVTKPKGTTSVGQQTPASSQETGPTAFVVQQPATPPEEKLSAWVPLFQSGLWALLVAGILIGFRKQIAGLIDRTSSVDIGPVKLQTPPEPAEPLSTAMPKTIPVDVEFIYR